VVPVTSRPVRQARQADPTQQGPQRRQAGAHDAAVGLDDRPVGRGNVILGQVGCVECVVESKQADDRDDASEEAEAENRYCEVLAGIGTRKMMKSVTIFIVDVRYQTIRLLIQTAAWLGMKTEMGTHAKYTSTSCVMPQAVRMMRYR